MSFIQPADPKVSRHVRASIITGNRVGVRFCLRIPKSIASVAGIAPGGRYSLHFGSAEDFGRVALTANGHLVACRDRSGQVLVFMTRRAPWHGGIRDADGVQMRLMETVRRATTCRFEMREPFLLVAHIPQQWFEPVEGAAVFNETVWHRRKTG